jgi:hypothetical protein
MRPRQDQAGLLAISYANPRDLTYGPDEDMEKPYFQYVSGDVGLRDPVWGGCSVSDDSNPARTHTPCSPTIIDARFGRDPKVIGRSFRLRLLGEQQGLANSPGMLSSRYDLYTIIGVAAKGFTGVEPGTITDIFVPTMMNPLVETDATWFRTFVILKPGVAVEPVHDELHAVFRAFREERAKALGNAGRWWPILKPEGLLEPAARGFPPRREFRKPLAVPLYWLPFLLVACAKSEFDDLPSSGTRGKWPSASLSALDERAWSNSYWWRRPSWPCWQP